MGNKTVFINGRPTMVQENVMSDDLVRLAMKDPNSNTIATIDSTGRAEIVPKGQKIRLAEGQSLQTQLDGRGGSS